MIWSHTNKIYVALPVYSLSYKVDPMELFKWLQPTNTLSRSSESWPSSGFRSNFVGRPSKDHSGVEHCSYCNIFLSFFCNSECYPMWLLFQFKLEILVCTWSVEFYGFRWLSWRCSWYAVAMAERFRGKLANITWRSRICCIGRGRQKKWNSSKK